MPCYVGGQLFGQVLPQEAEHLLPAVQRLLDAVGRPVVIEEAVAGAVVAVELIVLAVLLQFGLVLVDLFWRWRPVFVAKEAEQRARQFLCVFDRRDRLLGVQLLLAHHYPAAPQLARSVDAVGVAGIEKGLPPARAGTKDPDLTVEPGLG